MPNDQREQRREHRELDGRRQPLGEQVGHRPALAVRHAEIAARDAEHEAGELDRERIVEAEPLGELGALGDARLPGPPCWRPGRRRSGTSQNAIAPLPASPRRPGRGCAGCRRSCRLMHRVCEQSPSPATLREAIAAGSPIRTCLNATSLKNTLVVRVHRDIDDVLHRVGEHLVVDRDVDLVGEQLAPRSRAIVGVALGDVGFGRQALDQLVDSRGWNSASHSSRRTCRSRVW